MSRSVMAHDHGPLLARWGLTQAEKLCETVIAQLWKVQQVNGKAAVLKVYKQENRGNEAAGIGFLVSRSDWGAVHILQDSDRAVLMQWLEGPTLGDIARSGDLKLADQLLCKAANQLHNTNSPGSSNLRLLNKVFDPLFNLMFAANCKGSLRVDIQHATNIARRLLNSQPLSVPLHGDLHHDNIILTSSGPRIFDAKGYFGDPAFELANALRNPKGLPEMVRDPARIKRATRNFAQAMNVQPHRLAQWAAAKCALSIAWRAQGILSQDDENDLLALLLDQADQ